MRSFPALALLEFIDQESRFPRARLLTFGIASGIANGVLLAVTNYCAGQLNDFTGTGEIPYQLLAIYCTTLAIFVYTKKYTLDQAAVLVEEAICNVRTRILDKLRHADLQFMERTGHGAIYNYLAQDAMQISQSSSVIAASMQAGIMLVFAMAYIAWLTPSGFIFTIGAIVFGVWVFQTRRKTIVRDFVMAAREEMGFFASLRHTLDGFKEVKISRAKSTDLYRHQCRIASEVLQLKSRAGVSAVFIMMFSQVFFYVLIAVVLFVWPYFEQPTPGTVIMLTASILFIIGPLEQLVGSLPLYIRTDVSVKNLRVLERQLDNETRGRHVGEDPDHPSTIFRKLEFKDVVFEYRNDEAVGMFRVGPVSLQLEAGEIIFIVGGNGSGKSTLLKLLTGLYYPETGHLLVNGEVVSQEGYQDYREMFSIIFTDFHLFDRFYGVTDVDAERVATLIKSLGLAKKTAYRGNAFSTTHLSTGQRKRLAYITALLDDRQIYVFDEWAADQDPEFRKRFYEVMLPELRALGKTIVAVTHDDRYFHAADRVLRMEEGLLRP